MSSIRITIGAILIAGTLASIPLFAVSEDPCAYDVYSTDAANEYALYLRPLSPSTSGDLLGENGQDGSNEECKKRVKDAYDSEYKEWEGRMRHTFTTHTPLCGDATDNDDDDVCLL